MNEDEDRKTRGIRVYEDLADMLAWIVELENTTVARVVDTIARDEITRRFNRIRDRVDVIRAALAGDPLPVRHDLGGEG